MNLGLQTLVGNALGCNSQSHTRDALLYAQQSLQNYYPVREVCPHKNCYLCDKERQDKLLLERAKELAKKEKQIQYKERCKKWVEKLRGLRQ